MIRSLHGRPEVSGETSCIQQPVQPCLCHLNGRGIRPPNLETTDLPTDQTTYPVRTAEVDLLHTSNGTDGQRWPEGQLKTGPGAPELGTGDRPSLRS